MPTSSSLEKKKSSRLPSLVFLMGRKLRDEMDRCFGEGDPFSMLQFEALRYAGEKRPLMREMARYFSVTPSAATLLVEGLVDDKLLARVADKNDRRGVRLALTAKGKKTMEEAIQAKMRKLEDIFSSLNQKEQDQLAMILEKITKPGIERKR